MICLLFQSGVTQVEQTLLNCRDRRQNGTCRCIERYITRTGFITNTS